ncbi:Cache 3/Cache 2 fusion domain-containing protein [Oceanispirochaeta sp.]|jgi:methyl-accepting chemotaxis protein|uniref:Cache 3/Cache 2 fusion domain-containing protein n=1 Tax=Oceanispirochaeta sp. TaxID=2035350 RepID=UPI00262123E7|nr:Cache 3/Cache 2 fusion domain-containing protein [Oceanispirochaeta sp.]MDA3956924.1 Cache 3/Cache 2 fusion domain-containing protein [Oceanispirochaeta sp.]
MNKISFRLFFLIMSIILILIPAIISGFYNIRKTVIFVNESQIIELEDQLELFVNQIQLNNDFIPLLLENDYKLFEEKYSNLKSQSVDSYQRLVDSLSAETESVFTVFTPDNTGLGRIATSIDDSSGNKIIGTYIKPDTEVYRTTMSGKTYYGKAYIQGISYLTIYTPLTDNDRNVSTVLFAGIPINQYFKPLLDKISKSVIGEEGYFYILDSKGNYILSKNRLSDGKNIYDLKDAQGNSFIKDMIDNAILNEGEKDRIQYLYQNDGEVGETKRIAVYSYLEDFDWVIGASDHADRALNIINESVKVIIIISILSIMLGMFLSLIISEIILRSFGIVSDQILKISDGNLFVENHNVRFKELYHLEKMINIKLKPNLQDLVISMEKGSLQSITMSDVLRFNILQTIDSLKHVDSSTSDITEQSIILSRMMQESQNSTNSIIGSVSILKDKMDEQSSSTIEITASIEEMSTSLQNVSTVAKDKLANALELASLGTDGKRSVDTTQRVFKQVNEDIQSINDILDIITNISDQISLLAMNAAIEAAHAGEKGKGFAIVAGEMRKLANSTSKNGNKIKETIKETIDKIQSANSQSSETVSIIDNVVQGITSFTNAFQEIVDSTAEVSVGSTQILEGANLLGEINSQTVIESQNIDNAVIELSKAINYTSDSSQKNKDIAQHLNSSIQEVILAQNEMITLGELNKNVGEELKDILKSFTYNSDLQNQASIIDMIRAHQIWVERIQNHMEGNNKIDTAKIGDHHSCSLGHWLDSHSNEFKDQNEKYIILMEKHEMLHKNVSDIILNDLNHTDYDTKFISLKNLSHDVINRLLALLGYLGN